MKRQHARSVGYFAIVLSMFLTFLSINNCSKSKSSSTAAGVITGTVPVSCSSLGTGSENCSYRYAYDSTLCASHGCRKLLISFSDDNMTCDTTALSTYALDSYVAVCANLYETYAGATTYPYNKDESRVSALITAITTDTTLAANWSGEYLFYAGMGHGATSPVVSMARTTDFTQTSWQGTAGTAACLFEGIYDIPGMDSFAGANGCEATDPAATLPHGVVVGRYTGSLYLGGHDCGVGPCPCSPAHSSDVDTDSVINVSPTTLAITNWNLGECGSGLDPCTEDVVPAIGINTFCGLISSYGGYSCTFQSYPNISHSSCSVSYCQTWFDAQVSP